MNGLKRELIIKNLYDLQQLDSWEDNRDFISCVCLILSNNGVKWFQLSDIIDNELRLSFGDPHDDYKHRILLSFNDSIESFADLTNCGMTFDTFRTICLEYMDFSHLI